jgi:cytidyltransferase-like protein
MIVPTERLHELAGTVAMVDGGFDPLHGGHVAYFRGAAALGAPVLCNVSGDHYVRRKHRPLLPEGERAVLIAAIRYVDHVHISQTTTEAVLELLRPRYYVKGADWRGRLPDEQVRICAAHGTEIVYLDTVTNSSSRLLHDFLAAIASETEVST